MREVLVPALVALVGGLIVAMWQYGGYLSAMRRRLNEELEILSKMPTELAGRQEYQAQIEHLVASYLGWSRQPFRNRLRDAFRLGPDSRFAAPVSSTKSVAIVGAFLILGGLILWRYWLAG